MKLGALIDALKPLNPKLPVTTYCPDTEWGDELHGKGIAGPHSYRGYYDRLALEPVSGVTDVADVLRSLREAVGSIYEGWKGGSYHMDSNTHVHVAHRGNTGVLTAQVMPLDDRVLIVCAEEPW